MCISLFSKRILRSIFTANPHGKNFLYHNGKKLFCIKFLDLIHDKKKKVNQPTKIFQHSKKCSNPHPQWCLGLRQMQN